MVCTSQASYKPEVISSFYSDNIFQMFLTPAIANAILALLNHNDFKVQIETIHVLVKLAKSGI
jgi:hypothetical protein